MSELRMERSPKRVRALVAGLPVFDTRSAMLVWEKPYYPTYYVPRADVHAELVEAAEPSSRAPDQTFGKAQMYDVRVADVERQRAVVAFPDSPTKALHGLVRPKWDAMDEWLEEDEPVYVHPRDPYKRVDILASSRHVRVVVDDIVVAESHRPRILFETGLVPRFYLPLHDVRMDLLCASDSVTRCPYKGTANWWSLDVGDVRHDDLVWMYRAPTPESQKIAGLVSFFDERVDLYLDGVLQQGG